MKASILAICMALAIHALSLCSSVFSMGAMWEPPHILAIEMPSHMMSCCKPLEHSVLSEIVAFDRRIDHTVFAFINGSTLIPEIDVETDLLIRAPPRLALADPFHERSTIRRE